MKNLIPKAIQNPMKLMLTLATMKGAVGVLIFMYLFRTVLSFSIFNLVVLIVLIAIGYGITKAMKVMRVFV